MKGTNGGVGPSKRTRDTRAEVRRTVEKRRWTEHLDEALRARRFSAEETLEMGIGLIDLARELGKGGGRSSRDA